MLLIIASLFAIAPIQYPEAHRGNVVDTLHGVEVADPYRWLEQDVRESNDVRDWVQDENTITRQYLDSIETRPYIKETLTNMAYHSIVVVGGSNLETQDCKTTVLFTQEILQQQSKKYY
ncbi:MAG TPA: hypothetical protein EYO31_07530 [Phycisphaerales bacterium]|nr:hypothetical protein [Phycisphaerales bacterium]